MASMCWVKDSFSMFFHWPASYKDKKDRKLRETILTNNLNTNPYAAIWCTWTKKATVIRALPDWVLTYLVNFVRSINNIHLDFFMKICGRLQLLRGLERKTSSILLVKYIFRRGHWLKQLQHQVNLLKLWNYIVNRLDDVIHIINRYSGENIYSVGTIS